MMINGYFGKIKQIKKDAYLKSNIFFSYLLFIGLASLSNKTVIPAALPLRWKR